MRDQSPKYTNAHASQYKKNLIKKWSEDLNRYFSKEDIQMARRHVRRCPKSLITREKQIKTTKRCHLTPLRMTIIKKSTNNNCLRRCGETGTCLHHWWKYKLIWPLWGTLWRFRKKLKIELSYDSSKMFLEQGFHDWWGNKGKEKKYLTRLYSSVTS